MIRVFAIFDVALALSFEDTTALRGRIDCSKMKEDFCGCLTVGWSERQFQGRRCVKCGILWSEMNGDESLLVPLTWLFRRIDPGKWLAAGHTVAQ
jgi:hypothetical protein